MPLGYIIIRSPSIPYSIYLRGLYLLTAQQRLKPQLQGEFLRISHLPMWLWVLEFRVEGLGLSKPSYLPMIENHMDKKRKMTWKLG